MEEQCSCIASSPGSPIFFNARVRWKRSGSLGTRLVFMSDDCMHKLKADIECFIQDLSLLIDEEHKAATLNLWNWTIINALHIHVQCMHWMSTLWISGPYLGCWLLSSVVLHVAPFLLHGTFWMLYDWYKSPSFINSIQPGLHVYDTSKQASMCPFAVSFSATVAPIKASDKASFCFLGAVDENGQYSLRPSSNRQLISTCLPDLVQPAPIFTDTGCDDFMKAVSDSPQVDQCAPRIRYRYSTYSLRCLSVSI